MSVKVVVGAQWGDEGKGKMVDYLSQDADLIVRFQGGDNAGHTVVNDKGAFKLHLIPCGIFYDKCKVIVGTGTVVNPDELLKELNELEKCKVDTSGLFISSKAVILMPYHIMIDAAAEKGKGGIGTTKRGIGPAYADKARRIALRMEDLSDSDYLKERLEIALAYINKELKINGYDEVSVSDMLEKCNFWYKQLKHRIVEPVSFIHKFLDEKKNILFEGQLGVMKDIDLGIYPFVTSSNPVAAYACVSSGVPVKCLDNIVGVMKAFSSAVGLGPFPTEMEDEEAALFRGDGSKVDDEFGARTGRSRRLGWLDLQTVKYAADVNGFTELAVCKIDKLDNVKKIKVCVAYKLDGKIIDYMPSTREQERVEPVYEELDGWMCDTTKIRKISDLPENAKKYIALIEKVTKVKVKYAGVGPARENIAVL